MFWSRTVLDEGRRLRFTLSSSGKRDLYCNSMRGDVAVQLYETLPVPGAGATTYAPRVGELSFPPGHEVEVGVGCKMTRTAVRFSESGRDFEMRLTFGPGSTGDQRDAAVAVANSLRAESTLLIRSTGSAAGWHWAYPEGWRVNTEIWRNGGSSFNGEYRFVSNLTPEERQPGMNDKGLVTFYGRLPEDAIVLEMLNPRSGSVRVPDQPDTRLPLRVDLAPGLHDRYKIIDGGRVFSLFVHVGSAASEEEIALGQRVLESLGFEDRESV